MIALVAKKENSSEIPKDVVLDNVDDVKLVSKKDLMIAAKYLMLTIETNYGPRLLKKETAGVDWKTAKANFLASVKRIAAESHWLTV